MSVLLLVLTFAATGAQQAPAVELPTGLESGDSGCVFGYPWRVPSKAGDNVQVTRSYIVNPAESYTLRVLVGDDFYGAALGYHYKQILVDDEIVWQENVAGGQSGLSSIHVDLTEQVKGKSRIGLTFRTMDLDGVTNFGVQVEWQKLELSGLVAQEDGG